MSNARRRLTGMFALLLATAIWLPLVHLFFTPHLEEFRQADHIAPRAVELAARQLDLWEDSAKRENEIARMRSANAEWDFMSRTYFVMALANMALVDPPQRDRYLSVMDAVISETISLERERGIYFFLMDYAKDQSFIAQPPRSTFLDGEIAMMIAARQLVKPEARYAPLLADRVDQLVDYMSRGPVMCGESYPGECWMFCNALAAASIKLSDRLDGRDHSAFLQQWLSTVKTKLVHKESGLLVSSFHYDGRTIKGPEGSTIWMVAHCLQVVDPEFAAEQYRLARAQIGVEVAGFGFAREWPPSLVGHVDVDSGPVIPILGASAGASGMAFLGAAGFGDDEYLKALLATVDFAAFPIRADGKLRYAAGNQVGDSVLLYSLVQGPLWKCVPAPAGRPEK